MGLFDNVHILGVLVLLPYMVMFVNSTVSKDLCSDSYLQSYFGII